MSDAARCLAAYCPPVGVLVLLVFLFTLLVPKGERERTTDAPPPQQKKVCRHPGRGAGRE